jgi:hypothetical protein
VSSVLLRCIGLFLTTLRLKFRGQSNSTGGRRCPCGAWRIPDAPGVLMCHSAAAGRKHPRGARRRDQGLGTKSSALSTERYGSTAYAEYIGVDVNTSSGCDTAKAESAITPSLIRNTDVVPRQGRKQ